MTTTHVPQRWIRCSLYWELYSKGPQRLLCWRFVSTAPCMRLLNSGFPDQEVKTCTPCSAYDPLLLYGIANTVGLCIRSQVTAREARFRIAGWSSALPDLYRKNVKKLRLKQKVQIRSSYLRNNHNHFGSEFVNLMTSHTLCELHFEVYTN